MSEKKWTPGPWEAICLLDFSDMTTIWPIEFGYVGDLPPNSLTDKEQALIHANAIMAAAAPELYEALEEAVDHMENLPLAGWPTEFNRDLLLTSCRAALSKARGKS